MNWNFQGTLDELETQLIALAESIFSMTRHEKLWKIIQNIFNGYQLWH